VHEDFLDFPVMRERATHLLLVELTVDEDLAFRNVARQVGDGMRDVCRPMKTTLGLTSRNAPSLGIVKMGTWVIEPLRPSTRPARS
jgi:hypothetical protein